MFCNIASVFSISLLILFAVLLTSILVDGRMDPNATKDYPNPNIQVLADGSRSKISFSDSIRKMLDLSDDLLQECVRYYDPMIPPVDHFIFTPSESKKILQEDMFQKFGPHVPAYLNVTALEVQKVISYTQPRITMRKICNNFESITKSMICSLEGTDFPSERFTSIPWTKVIFGVETDIDMVIDTTEYHYSFISGQEQFKKKSSATPRGSVEYSVPPGEKFTVERWTYTANTRFNVTYDYAFGGEFLMTFANPYKDHYFHFWPVDNLHNCLLPKIRLGHSIEIDANVGTTTRTQTTMENKTMIRGI